MKKTLLSLFLAMAGMAHGAYFRLSDAPYNLTQAISARRREQEAAGRGPWNDY